MHSEISVFLYRNNLDKFVEDARLSFEDQLYIFASVSNADNPITYQVHKKGKKPKSEFDDYTEYLYYYA